MSYTSNFCPPTFSLPGKLAADQNHRDVFLCHLHESSVALTADTIMRSALFFSLVLYANLHSTLHLQLLLQTSPCYTTHVLYDATGSGKVHLPQYCTSFWCTWTFEYFHFMPHFMGQYCTFYWVTLHFKQKNTSPPNLFGLFSVLLGPLVLSHFRFVIVSTKEWFYL